MKTIFHNAKSFLHSLKSKALKDGRKPHNSIFFSYGPTSVSEIAGRGLDKSLKCKALLRLSVKCLLG